MSVPPHSDGGYLAEGEVYTKSTLDNTMSNVCSTVPNVSVSNGTQSQVSTSLPHVQHQVIQYIQRQGYIILTTHIIAVIIGGSLSRELPLLCKSHLLSQQPR